MKWGILATGTIAKKFASTVEQMGAEGEQLVAVGSRHMESAQAFAQQYGISCDGKTARQMTRRDYESYDYLIAMDHNNLRNMTYFVGSDPDHKVSLLMDHTRRPGDVADPWYTGDFEATWQDVLEGCTALLEELR